MVADDFAKCENNLKLQGKVAIITGGTSGLGLEVAKNLAKRGAKVIIASRNARKLDNAKEEIVKHSGYDNVVTRQMDFESLVSVRRFVNTTIETEPRVDILINNIGAYGLEDKLTENGLQTTMQVNYFGTFLLTYLLFPLLRKSAPSRIVTISSIVLFLGDVNFDKWNKVGEYSNFQYYCNSKLAETVFTVEMDRRIKDSGVKMYSMDPGLVKSKLFRHVENKALSWLLDTILLIFGRPPERTALMPVFLATDPRLEDQSGQHFRDCEQFYSHGSVNNSVFRENLWKETKKLVKIAGYEDWEK